MEQFTFIWGQCPRMHAMRREWSVVYLLAQRINDSHLLVSCWRKVNVLLLIFLVDQLKNEIPISYLVLDKIGWNLTGFYVTICIPLGRGSTMAEMETVSYILLLFTEWPLRAPFCCRLWDFRWQVLRWLYLKILFEMTERSRFSVKTQVNVLTSYISYSRAIFSDAMS
jgi:hypothetical protein